MHDNDALSNDDENSRHTIVKDWMNYKRGELEDGRSLKSVKLDVTQEEQSVISIHWVKQEGKNFSVSWLL